MVWYDNIWGESGLNSPILGVEIGGVGTGNGMFYV